MSKKQLTYQFLTLQERNKKLDVAPLDVTRNVIRKNILHPYLGFVMDPDLKEYNHNDEVLAPINKYGFLGDLPKNEKTIKVAIFGGSVAQELFLYSKNTLINALKESPALKDKDIEVVSVALGGMKQPQQLMALNYFLSLGIYFHLVINLDGFNEVALTSCENVTRGVFPFYPRSYDAYATKAFDPEMLYYVSEISRSKVKKIKYGNWLFNSPLRHSHFMLSLWIAFSNAQEKKQLEYDNLLKEALADRRVSEKMQAQERGPEFEYQSIPEMIQASVYTWGQTSLIMHQICKANKMRYFQFLQPNQYMTDSKVLTDWEMKNAFVRDETYCYKKAVQSHYPSLIAHAKYLKQKGVNFFDLTEIYKNEMGDIYKDNCCHVNQLGNDLIALNIAQAIKSSFK